MATVQISSILERSHRLGPRSGGKKIGPATQEAPPKPVGRGRQFRANSGLKSQEHSSPVLGLIFLRFAEVRFAAQRAKLEKAGASSRRGSRVDDPAAYHAERVVYLPPEARFDYLLNRPEGEDIGAKVNDAMRGVERHNPQLAGVLPKSGDPWPAYWAPLATRLMRRKQPCSSAEGPDWNERFA